MSRSHIPAFQLTAYSRLSMADTMQLARLRLGDAGAMVADIQRFSNKLIVFQLNVRLADWAPFLQTLLTSELNIDEPEIRTDLAAWADGDGDVFGTLAVVVSGDEHERKDQIPAVPG
ncbi:hypothetical protein KY495_19220 [Massilia sp. PAMC28688]|uniref:hypothetical protein n=1 Tax=Massilia sp. PAMC28688 TaxID=2861283 RepID=UPI001C629BB5|nr:hypothetical protein [Massilia sp. PAMC28688]QYF92826.1 hypothetical protein KY495_19220 [Massilia sp. PAMC28688]